MTNTPIAHVFTQVFSTPGGQRVLEALEKKFPEKTENFPSEDLRYFAGNRAVVKYINQLIKQGRGENE